MLPYGLFRGSFGMSRGSPVRVVEVDRRLLARGGLAVAGVEGVSAGWVAAVLDRHRIPDGFPFVIDDDGTAGGCGRLNRYKEKYPNDYLSHSTVNDWFRKKQVPEWPDFCKLLECFGEDVAAWEKIWWRAYNKQQPGQKKYLVPPATEGSADQANGRVNGNPLSTTQDQPFVLILSNAQQPPKPGRWLVIVVPIAALVVLAAAGTYLFLRPAPTDPGRGTGANKCMQITAHNARVFTAPDSKQTWTTWTTGTKFWADVEIRSFRYRTPLHNGRDGWITTDPRYVIPAHGCP